MHVFSRGPHEKKKRAIRHLKILLTELHREPILRDTEGLQPRFEDVIWQRNEVASQLRCDMNGAYPGTSAVSLTIGWHVLQRCHSR